MSEPVLAGHLLIDCLQRLGTRYVFGVPAESLLPMLDGLFSRSDIKPVITRHEEGAAMAAEAYAKATGSVGVCFGERAVAASHLALGIHTAQQDSTPLVALVGTVPRDFEHREAIQQMDIPSFFRPMTKWAVRVDDPDRLPEILAKAFLIASSGRPGPVVLALPEDILYAKTSVAPVVPGGGPALPAPHADSVRQAVDLLCAAKQPAVLAGGGVQRAQAREVLVQLAETLGMPVYAAWRRNDVFPNDHEHYAGVTGLGIQPDHVPGLRDADVVLAVGTRLSDAATCQYRLPRAGAKLIRLDIAPEMSPSVFPVSVGIAADAGLGLAALLAEARQRSLSKEMLAQRLGWIRQLREAYVRWSTPRSFESEPVDPEGVVSVLRQELSPETVLVTDAGNFAGWWSRYYPLLKPKTYFGPTVGGMGYALPACIGVKLAMPNSQVVGLAGDGGFLMTASELETAARMELPIVLLVFNNSGYGAIRMLQNFRFPGRQIATDFSDSNLAGLAQALGCYGERVVRDVDFAPALKRALASGKPAVLDLVMQRDRLLAYA